MKNKNKIAIITAILSSSFTAEAIPVLDASWSQNEWAYALVVGVSTDVPLDYIGTFFDGLPFISTTRPGPTSGFSGLGIHGDYLSPDFEAPWNIGEHTITFVYELNGETFQGGNSFSFTIVQPTTPYSGPPPSSAVPDAGNTAALALIGLGSLIAVHRKAQASLT